MSANAPYVTISKGLAGWFAVLVEWNPAHGGFYEPFATGTGRWKERSAAAGEGRDWAAIEGVEFRDVQDFEAKGEYPGTDLVDHEFELRPGLVVRLTLPKRITRPEAERLAAFFDALVEE